MRLKNEVFDKVYVSDLKRTRDTWRMVTAMQSYRYTEKNKRLEFSPQLRERNFGVLEGRGWGTLTEKEKEVEIKRDVRPKGGETWEDVAERTINFMNRVLDAKGMKGSSKVLVISHGGFIRNFVISAETKAGRPEWDDPTDLRNTSITKIRITRVQKNEIKCKILKFACGSHLN